MSTGPARVRWGRGGRGSVWSWRVGRWVRILPTVAFARGVCLATGINCQLLQFLISWPLADRLLPLLNPLQVALPLLVSVLPTFARRAGACHPHLL